MAESAGLVLEVAVRTLERRVVFERERTVLLDAQELVAPDHRTTVETVIVVADDAGMSDRDEREQALSATQDAAELVNGVVGVSLLERPEHSRVELVVARTVRDVRDAGK